MRAHQWVETAAEAISYEEYRRRKHPWNDPNDALEEQVQMSADGKRQSQLDGRAKSSPLHHSQRQAPCTAAARADTGHFQWWLNSDLRTEASEVEVCHGTAGSEAEAAVLACNGGTAAGTRERSSHGFSRDIKRLLSLQKKHRKACRRRAVAMPTLPQPFPRMDRITYLQSDRYKKEAAALHRKLGFVRQ
jgi:hypothetical protein